MKMFCLICLATGICLFSLIACAYANETIYYIDPSSGNDHNNGTSANSPWRTFNPVNNRQLSAGTTIHINPGTFHSSLVITGRGTSAAPIRVRFRAGTYHFYADSAYAAQWHITNTNDVPYQHKSVAIYVKSASYVSLQSEAANIIIHGKMIETAVDHSDHVTITGLNYDYFRPTVSELQVISVTGNYADLQINQSSTYSIIDSALWWEGEGWRHQPGWYWQVVEPITRSVERKSLDLSQVKFAKIEDRKVRAFFSKNPGLNIGYVYQSREIVRDCAGIFMQYSQDLRLEKIRINFMHGMGIVSQFCTNIRMKKVVVKPKDGTDRTCAAWADILHFSGCNGTIEVDHCYLSAANDDAINVHGTHLKIMEQPAAHQLKVKFMHDQTYGFDAFMPGDSIELVRTETLLPFATSIVAKAERLNDREILLTLQQPVSTKLPGNVVVENITRTPEVWIHHTTIASIPTRGILTTSRKKTLIEHNRFEHIKMSAVLISNDAESWFESGPVKWVEIRNNNFWYCGGPVIHVAPENKKFEGPVHTSIKVNSNRFTPGAHTNVFAARSAAHLEFRGNTIRSDSPVPLTGFTRFEHCTDIKVENNRKRRAESSIGSKIIH